VGFALIVMMGDIFIGIQHKLFIKKLNLELVTLIGAKQQILLKELPFLLIGLYVQQLI
jgi:hypothetical protein